MLECSKHNSTRTQKTLLSLLNTPNISYPRRNLSLKILAIETSIVHPFHSFLLEACQVQLHACTCSAGLRVRRIVRPHRAAKFRGPQNLLKYFFTSYIACTHARAGVKFSLLGDKHAFGGITNTSALLWAYLAQVMDILMCDVQWCRRGTVKGVQLSNASRFL
jgi:hypothetical protein